MDIRFITVDGDDRARISGFLVKELLLQNPSNRDEFGFLPHIEDGYYFEDTDKEVAISPI